MTYLDLVNKVLLRMRETEVTAVDATQYSKLIGEFVQQATSEVEDSWDWIQLRTTIQLPVVADLFAYVLTGAGSSFHILGVYEDQEDYRLHRAPSYQQMNEWLLQNEQTQGMPLYFDINGTDVNGDPVMNMWPIPDDSYSVNVNLKIKSPIGDKDGNPADSDETNAPWLPIVLRATYLAVEERGDDQGPSLQVLLSEFNSAVANAVMLDAGNYPNETIWVEE